jgi:hypothetical protein
MTKDGQTFVIWCVNKSSGYPQWIDGLNLLRRAGGLAPFERVRIAFILGVPVSACN